MFPKTEPKVEPLIPKNTVVELSDGDRIVFQPMEKPQDFVDNKRVQVF